MADDKAGTYYMAIALLSAKRSKDEERQDGACIVNEEEERIVSIGYNGMPLNCRDDLMPWAERNDEKEKEKYLYVAHAEMNAIVSMTPRSVAGCAIYTTMPPCVECLKMMMRSGIEKVVYPEAQLQVDEKRILDHLKSKMKINLFKVDRTVVGEDNTLKIKFGSSDGSMGTNEKTAPISWEQYFMGMAIIARDIMCDIPEKKEGACIVNEDKRIVGIGYLRPEIRDGQFNVVLHSPVGAIVNKSPVSVRDCTLYMTCFPCNECTKVIVQAGLKAVIYLDHSSKSSKASTDVKKSIESCADSNSDEKKMNAAKKMLNLGKIRCDPYEYEKSQITLKFPLAPQGAATTPPTSSVTKED